MRLFSLLAIASLAAAGSDYSESLGFRPLARNKLLASFQFEALLVPYPLEYVNASLPVDHGPRHYGKFPKALEPVVRATNTRDLHLRFTQGWWDAESWGKLPANGSVTGGTGVELWASIEASSIDEARANWLRLAESLSGFFCALLNFVNSAITTFPRHESMIESGYVASANNSIYLMRAALPDEPICTENLTPFLKMLPTRGKAGIASLLDGHKLYDSLWHSMSIDLSTECGDDGCHLRLHQNIHQIVDVMRLIRRKTGGGIPKPVLGDDLRCDETKQKDAWTCFPLGDETEIEWDIESIFGRPIKGPGFEDSLSLSVIHFDTNREFWKVQVHKIRPDNTVIMHDVDNQYVLEEPLMFNFNFKSRDSRQVQQVERPPVAVSRSLTGYSQDRGGIRVKFQNPSDSESVSVLYSETLPWFMRVYLHTLEVSGSGLIDSQFYIPAIDRVRPGYLELEVTLPPGGALTFTYQFDKSLLLYAEYPPDANHGFSIDPAVVKVVDADNEVVYQLRTASLLLTLPTPDFSMPYNVIILTCTVMSLAFGTVFNLLTKKVITEEEFEEISKNLKLSKFKAKIQSIKAKIKGT
ncbi:CIC11C00000001446 [Sungouiella intermedia]|uniref:CIC11C00000001446 n=1 Tax=Sungouiella intermedia TaxID=45354 RepID=A0A1L0BM99_9ASCO|nr:CIC11C00000001446 [[Candida] intermedia]